MHQHRIGLALSGGAIKGFAHIGLLRRLEELDIRPDIIAGTSAGALVSSLYVDGYRPHEIFNLLSELKPLDLVLKSSMLGSRLSSLATLFGSKASDTDFPYLGSGVVDTTYLLDFLHKHLRHKRLEDLPTPLSIIATDFDRGEQHVFHEGELAPIVVASCSIPILFKPISIEGVTYVDGGLFRNFPASVIRSECDTLIGMNLSPWVSNDYELGFKDIAIRMWQLLLRQNTLHDKALCDILLENDSLLRYGMFDVDSAKEIEAIGYDLALNSPLLALQGGISPQ